jgi:hypothetical protein
MSKTKLLCIPSAAFFNQERPADWDHAHWRFLAEGDSWFSLGGLNPLTSANLLEEMRFSSPAAAVQCAFPGDTLTRMVQMNTDPLFQSLLVGVQAWPWDAVLLSCGGNDLIDAAGAPASAALAQRLFRVAAERGGAAEGPARHISEAGWASFATYFRANLQHMVALRDQGPAAGRPLCLHTYAYPTPRPSGAGAGQGPWLHPAMVAYGIDQAERQGVAELLLDRLSDLMLACAADTTAFPQVFVFDSRVASLGLEPAAPGSTGNSGDWLNEIHLNRRGCRKFAQAWSAQIEAVLPPG